MNIHCFPELYPNSRETHCKTARYGLNMRLNFCDILLVVILVRQKGRLYPFCSMIQIFALGLTDIN